MRNCTYIILIVFIFCFQCKPDSDAPCRNSLFSSVGFSSDEAGKFPFAGKGDTLRYINSAGDSIWCLGAPKNIFYKCVPLPNNPQCPADSLGYPIYQVNYADTLSKFIFSAMIKKYDDSLTVNANGSSFSFPIPKVGVKDSLTWFDSLQFGNKMFYGINTLKNTNGDSLYYNTKYGMIGLKQAANRFYLYKFNNY